MIVIGDHCLVKIHKFGNKRWRKTNFCCQHDAKHDAIFCNAYVALKFMKYATDDCMAAWCTMLTNIGLDQADIGEVIFASPLQNTGATAQEGGRWHVVLGK